MCLKNTKGTIELTIAKSPKNDSPLDSELLLKGIAHHQAGRLREAEAIYKSILEEQPQHPKALLHLGILAYQLGKIDITIDLLEKAIAIRPDYAEAQNMLGNAFSEVGREKDALACYEQAIAIEHDYAEAHYNLGNALKKLGRLNDALACYEQAIAIKPDFVDAHNNMGNALKEVGRKKDALVFYQQAISIKSDYGDAHYNLGNILQQLGGQEDALACYEQALAINPDSPEVHNALGVAYQSLDRQEDALDCYERALGIKPNYIEVLINMGSALRELDRQEDSIDYYKQALTIMPDNEVAYNDLGNALNELGRQDDAMVSYKRALVIKPDYAEAHTNLGTACLLAGHFAEGWKHYEWRWKLKKFTSPKRSFEQPIWDGLPINGKTILLHTEQGLGDSIQFIRYVSSVAEYTEKIIIECEAILIDLFADYRKIAMLVMKGETLPNFDIQAPLLSLPCILRTTLETIPEDTSYISSNDTLIKTWEKKLVDLKNFKVGICWQGSREHKNDKNRSIQLIKFSKLLVMDNIDFVSLQKGYGQEQIDEYQLSELLNDFTSDIDTFSDTSALMAHLDLIIGVDTAAIHLAGAIGKPVWVLLPHLPDWRWMLEREDSPWYPSMRLFRQKKKGDWESVMIEIIFELEKLINSSKK